MRGQVQRLLVLVPVQVQVNALVMSLPRALRRVALLVAWEWGQVRALVEVAEAQNW